MSALEPATLRCSAPREVAQHLRAVVGKGSEEEITKQLISFVEIGLVPPRVFAPWLRISPKSLHSALLQEISINIRRQAIKELRKVLRTSQWVTVWDAIGGVQGWIDLFSRFSVVEVKEACRAIGKSGISIDCEAKREKVTELFKALQPRLFPETPHPSSDGRTLSAQYRRLLPTCTRELLTEVIEGKFGGVELFPHDVRRRLFHLHSETLQTAALRYIFEKRSSGRDWLKPLLHHYPAKTAPPKGCSASMMFSLTVLQRMVKEGSPPEFQQRCIDDVIQPLVKRAVNKKAEWPFKQKVVEQAVKYLQTHPEVSSGLEFKRNGLLHLVAVCWSCKPDMFESQFAALLTRAQKATRKGALDDCEKLLAGVPLSRRYAVLRFAYKITVGRDLDVKSDLQGAQCVFTRWLLQNLPAEEALGLFNRLRTAQGSACVIPASWRDTFLGSGATPDSKTADVDMWQTVFLRRAGRQKEAEDLAMRCMPARKQAAASGSTPEQRAFYAKAVLHYAIACESLELYQQAHEWAQRFVRDPQVAITLYQNPDLEARKLLSGIPENLRKDTTASQLRERVTLANRILSSLFDTACSALREPSFSCHNWHGTLASASDAIRHRIKLSNKVKEVMGLSEEELYDTLWKDAISVLIAMEEKALEPSHSRLHAKELSGIVAYRGTISLPETTLLSTYQFVDELAKARDELWRRYRPTVHPVAVSLPEPFPLGLPVQHLSRAFTFNTPSLIAVAPYIASRRDAALFPDSVLAQRAVSSDEETQNAIGPFVEDYYFALELFLPSSLSKEERIKRRDEVWAYAVSPLSQRRMSPGEALRYWQTEKKYKGLPLAKKTTEPWPLMPDFDPSSRANEVEEWSPIPADVAAVKTRTLENVTYIDLSKRASKTSTWMAKDILDHSPPTIPGVKYDEVWSAARIDEAKGLASVQEAQILSSLLYLETMSSTQASLLAKAYPGSSDHVRYPPVFLDEQFLAGVRSDKDAALVAIKAHMTTLPALLLQKLTENATKKLEATSKTARGYVNQERLTFQLIQLLGHSDRPTLVSDIAVRTIIERPDASSWHRRLLTPGYFRRIPAKNAQACIASLADGIVAKLGEQAKAKKAKGEKTDDSKTDVSSGGESKGRSPFVKVTTIKFLAQLLCDTESVSESFALSVLKMLIEKASHVDIRREVVNSLLSMLQTAPPTSVEQIITALEAMIPVAGNIRERRPIKEDEWTRIEETLELPELTVNFSLKEDAPMLASLLFFLGHTPNGQAPCMHNGILVERILIPIIESLKKQTERWVNVFLRKHNFDDVARTELNIPSPPWDKTVISSFLDSAPSHVPLAYLENYVAYLRFNVETPPPLASFIKTLNDDPSLRDTPDAQIFITRFGAGTDIILPFHMMALAKLVQRPLELRGPITVHHLQQRYLTLYTSVLWHDTGKSKNVGYMPGQLWRMACYSEIPKTWIEHQGPVVEAIIMYVEGLRTREWDRDPNRRPATLPDTFLYRMWLLRYAAQHSPEADTGDLEAHCKKFAERVAKIAESLAGGLYHRKFQLLQESLEYLHGENRPRVACHLGDITKTKLSWLTMPDLLRVELAAGLLKVKRGDSEVMPWDLGWRVERLKESWRGSENEQVRMLGFGHE